MSTPWNNTFDSSKATIIAMIRVSSDGQADKATPETQIHCLKAMITSLGVKDDQVTWVELGGVSGDHVSLTSEWREVIRPRLHRDPTAHLAVYNVGRLCRAGDFSPETFAALHDVATAKKPVLSYVDGIIPHTEVYKLGEKALRAGEERRMLRELTTAGKERVREAGGRATGAQMPTGTRCDKNGKGKGVTYRWDYTPEIGQVKEAYKLLVEHAGNISIVEVARRVGLTSATAGNRIVSWVRNPIYRGVRRYDQQVLPAETVDGRKKKTRKKAPREKVIEVRVYGGEGQVEQAVSDDVWYRAQWLLGQVSERSRKVRQKVAETAPYSGLLYSSLELKDVDAEAKHVVWSWNQTGGRSYYLCACRNGKNHADRKLEPCGLPLMHADAFTRAIDTLLVRVTTEHKEAIEAHALASIVDIEEHSRRREARRQALLNQLADLERSRKRLITQHTAGLRTDEEMIEEAGKLKAAKAQLDDTLAALDAEAPPAIDGDKIRAYVRDLLFDPAWSPDVKRRWVQRHVAHLGVSDLGVQGITVRLLGPITWGAAGDFDDDGRIAPWLTWEELIGFKPADAEARRQKLQGLYRPLDVAELLGVGTGVKGTGRLAYLSQKGLIGPQRRWWTAEQIEEARVAIEKAKAEGHYPDFDHATNTEEGVMDTPAVCKALGVTYGQLRHAMNTGKVTRPARRGHRSWWTSEEVERARREMGKSDVL